MEEKKEVKTDATESQFLGLLSHLLKKITVEPTSNIPLFVRRGGFYSITFPKCVSKSFQRVR